ncbi:hypothetical protein F5883DRAFT_527810 [Diaporthe sp. PMI_573]|nr:hypothetical protein F5883DRAFT_527810 [Diaporthaceae sp. PMI_573]
MSQTEDPDLFKQFGPITLQCDKRSSCTMRLVMLHRDTESFPAQAICLRSLYTTDPQHDREELLHAKGAIAQNTCNWILSTAEFTQWHQRGPDSKGLLWIYGGPGSGKTMISIYLSKYLENPTNMQSADQSHLTDKDLVLYFFCNGSDTTKSSETGVLRGLLFQAINQRPDLLPLVQQIYETQGKDIFQDWPFDMLWMALRAIILGNPAQDAPEPTVQETANHRNPIAYVIVDGLDECEQASVRKLVVRLSSLDNDQELSRKMKVMIVSREKPAFRDAFAGHCLRLNLEEPRNAQAVSADVQRHIVQQVDKMASPDRKDYSNELCTSVKQCLTQNSQSNFLWVSMAITELEATSRIEAWEHLSRIPPTLDAMYEWMVMQIPHGWRELSTKVLLWATLAFRPLSLAELLVALDERRFGLADAETLQDCIKHCGQILRIAADSTVHLVHHTAREYLLERLQSSPSFFKDCVEVNPFNLEEAHRLIASICIRNLGSATHPGIQNLYKIKSGKATDTGVIYTTSMSTVLSDYAMAFWTDHFKESKDLMLDIFDSSPLLFKEHSSVRGVLAHEASKGLLTQDVPVLHHAAYHGFVPLVRRLLKKGLIHKLKRRRLVRQKDSLGRTALHLAVYRDENGPMVELLLDRGAGVYCKDHAGATVLDNAIKYGTAEMVAFLRAKGQKD